MASKSGPPAPIDRPLSRAYLREFTGWSTAFPPGASEPTSLRDMNNVFVERDGALRIRPGMRKILSSVGVDRFLGDMEPFYSGSQLGYLIASYSPFANVVNINAYSLDGSYVATPEEDRALDLPDFSPLTRHVSYVQIDNKIVAMADAPGETNPLLSAPALYFVGENQKMRRPRKIVSPNLEVRTDTNKEGLRVGRATGNAYTYTNTVAGVTKVERRAVSATGGVMFPHTYVDTGSLISSDPAMNKYNFGFFCTFSNEFGETHASGMHVIKTQRPHGQWILTTTPEFPADPAHAPDRLAVMYTSIGGPTNRWELAAHSGATHFNVYCAMWSDDGVVPTEGVLVESVPMNYPPDLRSYSDGWIEEYAYAIMTPEALDSSRTHPIPSQNAWANPALNSTAPGSPANAIVSADRIVYAYDRSRPGVIRWGSSLPGEYLNTSPYRGGGFKTLTSGNMQIPAAPVLWQNPQSADTLTILNLGTGGHSTSVYMAPAEVSGQTDSASIMGFENVTSTPGTTSPFAVEVFNNALYHPQPDQLMKSTANNYNLSHKSLTENIRNQWERLGNREMMMSAEHDGRLYYIVTPTGSETAPDSAHCNGTEIWVYDALGEKGTWSRWTIPAISMKKVEHEGRTYMSVLRPEGVYLLDPEYALDDYHDDGLPPRPIEWNTETNTQGANRAHDAWAHLRQVALTLGSFSGKMRYGIRGLDMHGEKVVVEKVFESQIEQGANLPPGLEFDQEDFLKVGRDMKEWFFYASSFKDADEVTAHSMGRLNGVQYRYTPVSVNVNSEQGSVETFEYGNSNNWYGSRTTESGVTRPISQPTIGTEQE